jgi:thiol-disulfide isomerase/thioredoxin
LLFVHTDTGALQFPKSTMKRIASRIAAYCLVMFLFCCHRETQQSPATIFSYRLSLSNDSLLNFETLKNNKASVFVFLAPDCPLSQSYTLTLNELHGRFADAHVGFYGVVESSNYQRKEIDDYITQYRIELPIVLDAHSELARLFGAMVTPEVFVVNSEGQTVYMGAIDNWAPELGQHRTVITEHYLLDALNGFIGTGDVSVPTTKPVGCFIELGH